MPKRHECGFVRLAMYPRKRKTSEQLCIRKSYGMIFQAPPTVAALVLAPKYTIQDPIGKEKNEYEN